MKSILVDFKLLLTLFSASLLIFVTDNFGLLKIPKTAVQFITVPIEYGLYRSGVSLSKQFGFIVLARTAYSENIALKRQLGDLLVENANLRKKIAEEQIMIDQKNGLNPATYDLLPTRLIGASRYLNLDRGANDGVKVGQIVVYKDSFIGKIKELSSKTSSVLLSRDPDSKIAVFSQGQNSRARGVLIGQFGSQMLMDKILHQEQVKAGDLVYSEGTEGNLPRGLVVGKVAEVLERQNEVFKQAKVEPIYDINSLDLVFIVTGP